MYFDKSVILMWFLSECHINPHSTIGTWRPWQVEQSLTPPSWICVQDGSKHFIGSHEKSETDESKITMTSWEETEAQRTEVNHLRSQRYSVEKQGSRMVSGQFLFFFNWRKIVLYFIFFFNWGNNSNKSVRTLTGGISKLFYFQCITSTMLGGSCFHSGGMADPIYV